MKEDIYHLGIKALINNSQGFVLLLQVNKASLKGYDGIEYWDIPGGRVLVGHTPEETLRREVKEETDLEIKSSPILLGTVLSPIRIPLEDGATAGLILSIYACEVENTDNIKLSTEHISYRWCSRSEASKLLEFKYPKDFCLKIATS